MKTKTITALEQALADLGFSTEPRHPDEQTAVELHAELGGIVSIHTVQRRLKALVDEKKYTRRRFGKDFLYRKNS